MYGNFGSISGIIHLVARRPVVAATIVLAAVVVANTPSTPPPPPTPPPPAVMTVPEAVPSVPEPTPYVGSRKHTTYACEFSKAAAPTNLCKATLDSVALFLQNDTEATVVVTGKMNHALAVRRYLVQGEAKLGIDPRRVKIEAEGNSNTVTIEQIP